MKDGSKFDFSSTRLDQPSSRPPFMAPLIRFLSERYLRLRIQSNIYPAKWSLVEGGLNNSPQRGTALLARVLDADHRRTQRRRWHRCARLHFPAADNPRSEQAAFEKMRITAMDKGLKLADVAQRMLDVLDLLG